MNIDYSKKIEEEFRNNNQEKCTDCYHKQHDKRRLDLSTSPKRCSECSFAQKDVGRFDGDMKTEIYDGIQYFKDIDLFERIPIKDKSKIRIANASQAQFDKIMLEASVELKSLFICTCQKISNFKVIERFSELEIIWIKWNNKAEQLWDFSKTPSLKGLMLEDVSKIRNLDCLKDLEQLEYFGFLGERGAIESLSWLNFMKSIKSIDLTIDILDRNIVRIINNNTLKEVWLSPTLFDVESYAMLEVRRPDLLRYIKNGVFNDAYTVGKKFKVISELPKEKQESYKKAYAEMLDKYKTEDYLPLIQKESIFPTDNWRQSAEEFKRDVKVIDEIESILKEYSSNIVTCANKSSAKKITQKCIASLNSLNQKTGFIETEEREVLFDYISSYFKEEWYDDLEEFLENSRDW